MNYYIADLHLGHYNSMAKFDKRPFKTLDEQDEIIINNINNTVKSDDNLYLLGDVFWYSADKAEKLLKQIKCKNIYLIIGNHDKWLNNNTKKYFKGIYDLKRINDNGNVVILCHYPLAVWDQSHRGSYHLYGHVHNNMTDDNVKHTILNHKEMKNSFNVGCMMKYINYIPRTLDELKNSLN